MKRYTLFSQYHDNAYVGEHEQGEYVRYEDIFEIEDVDKLPKLLCRIARANGWQLTYKLEKLQ